MADFIEFDEGSKYLLTHGDGLPSPCYFLLSTLSVDQFTVAATLAGGLGEIAGTGYGRRAQNAPTPVGGVVTFAPMSWSTGSATNWPNGVKSVALVSSGDNTGKAVCAWNLVPGGVARDLSSASAVETVTPSFTLASGATGATPPGGGGSESTAYNTAVLADAPVFFLTDSTADSGSGHHAIQIVGGAAPIIVLPNGGKAWSFDSSGAQYLNVPDPANGDLSINSSGQGLTVECWFQLGAINQPNELVVGSGPTRENYVNFIARDDWLQAVGALQTEWELRYYSQHTVDPGNGPFAVVGYAFNPTGGLGAGHDDRTVKTTNTWYHMVAVYTDQPSTVGGVSYPDGYVMLYFGSPSQPTASINSFDAGLIIDSFSASGSAGVIVNPAHTGVPMTIGLQGANEATHPSFFGSIGKVAVYPKVLSATRIRAHYDAMMGGSGGGGNVPTVTSVSPATGPTTGGTSVTITGTNLNGATGVFFAGIASPGYVVNSSTQIVATAPAGTAGVVDITVQTAGGVSSTVTGDHFTYTAPVSSGSAYDSQIVTDGALMLLDGSTVTSNLGSKSLTITNENSVGTSATLPNGDKALTFNGSTQWLWIQDPTDGSLSINKTGKLTVEAWIQLGAMEMPNPAPGFEGGINFITKCIDASPPLDPTTPTTDGNEWELRYFNAGTSNTNSGSNPYGDFCGYAFNKAPLTPGGSSFGAGFDDHMLDITATSTGKTTAMWFYLAIAYDLSDMSSQFGANYAHGGITMFGGIYGRTDYIGQRFFTAPMFVSFAPTADRIITPTHTTAPLTIGTGGYTSHLTTGVPTSQGSTGYFQGKLGKVAIYPTALTETQTKAHFALMH